jgi:hypothetical protein
MLTDSGEKRRNTAMSQISSVEGKSGTEKSAGYENELPLPTCGIVILLFLVAVALMLAACNAVPVPGLGSYPFIWSALTA